MGCFTRDIHDFLTCPCSAQSKHHEMLWLSDALCYDWYIYIYIYIYCYDLTNIPVQSKVTSRAGNNTPRYRVTSNYVRCGFTRNQCLMPAREWGEVADTTSCSRCLFNNSNNTKMDMSHHYQKLLQAQGVYFGLCTPVTRVCSASGLKQH